jgi:protocatechuate 3,4-dioxygenase alpha subunit
MEKIQQTPSQTVGPFFAYSLTAAQYGYDYNSIVSGSMVNDETEGERIYVTGRVFDGNNNTISDAMIELLQADPMGNYVTGYPDVPISQVPFTGFGRLGTGTNPGNRFTFKTIKPGALPGQSPHINVILFMRGSLHALYTRLYFSDEENDEDPFFKSIDVERRYSLVAQRKEVNGSITYHFDIHMQGENETVFFKIQ